MIVSCKSNFCRIRKIQTTSQVFRGSDASAICSTHTKFSSWQSKKREFAGSGYFVVKTVLQWPFRPKIDHIAKRPKEKLRPTSLLAETPKADDKLGYWGFLVFRRPFGLSVRPRPRVGCSFFQMFGTFFWYRRQA